MFEINWISIAVAALIPMIVGSIWYGPLFGKAWMKSMGFTEESLKEANMPMIMGISLVLAFVLSFFINYLLEGTHKECNAAGEVVWGSFHTFKHGALHGAFYGILFAMPMIIINGMFERKTWTNIFIHVGYWTLTMALMGGLLDAW